MSVCPQDMSWILIQALTGVRLMLTKRPLLQVLPSGVHPAVTALTTGDLPPGHGAVVSSGPRDRAGRGGARRLEAGESFSRGDCDSECDSECYLCPPKDFDDLLTLLHVYPAHGS
jgi:hypothetical protein